MFLPWTPNHTKSLLFREIYTASWSQYNFFPQTNVSAVPWLIAANFSSHNVQSHISHSWISVFTPRILTGSVYVTLTLDSYLWKNDFMVNLSSLWATKGGGSFVSCTKFCAYYVCLNFFTSFVLPVYVNIWRHFSLVASLSDCVCLANALSL